MKKIFLFFAAVVMTAGVLSAQDINQALELYNNGAMELQMGNNSAAVENFQNALTMGEALGDEGADLVANCKKAICSATLAMAKDLYNAKDFDNAIIAFGKAKEVAEGYGEAEIAAEAAELIGQTEAIKYNTDGKAAMRAKNYPAAIECFSKVLELDPTNGAAAFQLGQAHLRAKQMDEALAAFEVAKANGQEENANKMIAQIYATKAAASNKAKKYQEALDLAAKSNGILENGAAYRVIGQAYTALGKTTETIAAFEKYLELSPKAKDKADILYTIGALYHQSGDKAKAKEYYQMVASDPRLGPQVQELLKSL